MDFGVVKFPNGSLQPYELQTHQQYFVDLRRGDKREDDFVEALKTAVALLPEEKLPLFFAQLGQDRTLRVFNFRPTVAGERVDINWSALERLTTGHDDSNG